MIENFKPLNDYIVLELAPKSNMKGSIIITNEVREQWGIIVSVGPKVKDVYVGQKVQFEHGQFKPLQKDGEKEYALVKEEHVIGIFETN